MSAITEFVQPIVEALNGIREELHLVREQLTERPQAATEALPERCAGIHASRCALQDDDARIAKGSFSNPNAWQCRGCRFQES